MVAGKDVRQRCRTRRVEEVEGERAGRRIAARADVGDQLHGADFHRCQRRQAEAYPYAGDERIGRSLAVAVRTREDRRALWRKDDRRAAETGAGRWSRYRNVVRTRRAQPLRRNGGAGRIGKEEYIEWDRSCPDDIKLLEASKGGIKTGRTTSPFRMIGTSIKQYDAYNGIGRKGSFETTMKSNLFWRKSVAHRTARRHLLLSVEGNVAV